METTSETKNTECLSINPGWSPNNLPYIIYYTTRQGTRVILHATNALSDEQLRQLWDSLSGTERDFYALAERFNWKLSDAELHITLFNATQPYNPRAYNQPNYNPFPPGLLGQAQHRREDLPNGTFQLITLIDIPFECFPPPLGSPAICNDDGSSFRHELGHIFHYRLNNGGASIWPAVSDGFAEFIAELNSNICDDIRQTRRMPPLREILILTRNFQNQYVRGRWFIQFMREENPFLLGDLLRVNPYEHTEIASQITENYIHRYEGAFANWIAEKQCGCPAAGLCERDRVTRKPAVVVQQPTTTTSLPVNSDIMNTLLAKNSHLQEFLKNYGYINVHFVFSETNQRTYCALTSGNFYCVVNNYLIDPKGQKIYYPIQRDSIHSLMAIFVYGRNDCTATPLKIHIRSSSLTQSVNKQHLQDNIIKIIQTGYQWDDLLQAAAGAGLPSPIIQSLTNDYLYPPTPNRQSQTATSASQNCTYHLAVPVTSKLSLPTPACPFNLREILQNLFDKNSHLQHYTKDNSDVAFVFFSDERRNHYCRLVKGFYCASMDPKRVGQETSILRTAQQTMLSIMEMYIYGDNCAKTPMTILLSHLRQAQDELSLQEEVIKRTQEGYQWKDLKQAALAVGVDSNKIQSLEREYQRCRVEWNCARSCGTVKSDYLFFSDSCQEYFNIHQDDFSLIQEIKGANNQSVGEVSSTNQSVVASRVPFSLPKRFALEVSIGLVNGLTSFALEKAGKKLKQRYPEQKQRIDRLVGCVAIPLLISGFNLARIPLSNAVFWAEDASLTSSIASYFGSNLAISVAIKAIQALIQRWVGEGKISQAFNFIIFLSSVTMLVTSQDFNDDPLPATLGYTANVVASMAIVALATFVEGMYHPTAVSSNNVALTTVTIDAQDYCPPAPAYGGTNHTPSFFSPVVPVSEASCSEEYKPMLLASKRC